MFECGQTVGELFPGRAAVCRFEKAALFALPRTVLPRALPPGPEVGVNNLRIRRVKLDLHRAGVLVFVEDAFECLAAVGRSIDAAFGIWSVRVAEHGDEEPFLVLRVDGDRSDLLTLAEPEMLPCLSAVIRAIHPITGREIGSLEAFAASDVDHVRVRRGDRYIADRAGRLVIEYWFPGSTGVVGLPYAAVIDSDIEDVRLRRDADRTDRAPGSKRPDHSPTHRLIKRCVDGLSKEIDVKGEKRKYRDDERRTTQYSG